ncbi:MAG TPA: FtsX-like permease family protein [Steroidobacteraceae bacterium]|jgi:putative ABC transport system permease protein|nr:FtsX-like permease family protein [Steroidobacteraceae bacterium]
MELRPILSGMRRNKVGAVMIALEIAVALAIFCNAIFVIQQRLALMSRPTGVDEADIFAVINQWVGTPEDESARIRADVAALRAMPGVKDAYESNTQPLTERFWGSLLITLHPDDVGSLIGAADYFGDQRTLDTLGVKLAAGRNFTATEISDFRGTVDHPRTGGILVTRALAEQLAPGGQVLGQIATIIPLAVSAPIIGIMDRLQAPFVDADGMSRVVDNSVLLPYRFLFSRIFYIVRVRHGDLDAAMREAPEALAAVSRDRVILRLQALTAARGAVYRGSRTVALMLSWVCILLVAVTAFGITGLTSYWVAQRRLQIGIRRALGATRPAITRYFQTENVLITGSGVVVGAALATVGNLWMVKNLSMARLPIEYLVIGVIAMLALGQLAVLWPALRAASVPPAKAMRTS